MLANSVAALMIASILTAQTPVPDAQSAPAIAQDTPAAGPDAQAPAGQALPAAQAQAVTLPVEQYDELKASWSWTTTLPPYADRGREAGARPGGGPLGRRAAQVRARIGKALHLVELSLARLGCRRQGTAARSRLGQSSARRRRRGHGGHARSPRLGPPLRSRPGQGDAVGLAVSIWRLLRHGTPSMGALTVGRTAAKSGIAGAEGRGCTRRDRPKPTFTWCECSLPQRDLSSVSANSW